MQCEHRLLSMIKQPSLAVIVPFFNEEEAVGKVCGELRSVLDLRLPDTDVILLDDGSDDRTGERLNRIAATWPQCRVFRLGQNRGQSAALLFGFGKAEAPILATMDGDGQNDPNDLVRLLGRMDEADMVVGKRMDRQDFWTRRTVSRIANLVRSRWLGDGVSDAGCALKVFRREVVEAFIPIRTLYSFMPALAVAAGYRVVEEPVHHRRRALGTSKYSTRSFLFWPIIDFVGLAWFRVLRCHLRNNRRPANLLGERSLGDELYHRGLHRWLTTASVAIIATVLMIAFLSLPSRVANGPADRKINLGRAEHIALQAVPRGRLRTEELRMADGRLAWLIDVQPKGSTSMDEVEIDAVNGHVIATRVESPEEEEFELAVEDHRIDPHLLRRPH